MRNWTLAVSLALVMPLSASSAPCTFASAGASYQAFIASESLPGGALLIGTRQGLLHERYFGTYDAQSVVAIASASKLASAIRIAQLIDRGRIDPEARCPRICPRSPAPRVR